MDRLIDYSWLEDRARKMSWEEYLNTRANLVRTRTDVRFTWPMYARTGRAALCLGRGG